MVALSRLQSKNMAKWSDYLGRPVSDGFWEVCRKILGGVKGRGVWFWGVGGRQCGAGLNLSLARFRAGTKKALASDRQVPDSFCVFGGTVGTVTLHSGPIHTLKFLALNPDRQYRQCHTLVELDDGRALTIRFSLLVYKCDDMRVGALVSACDAS